MPGTSRRGPPHTTITMLATTMPSQHAANTTRAPPSEGEAQDGPGGRDFEDAEGAADDGQETHHCQQPVPGAEIELTPG